jgi:hypothetical protein
MLGIPRSYFELPEDSIVDDESHEETRYAELSEVMYIACHIAPYDWEKSWQPRKGKRCPLKGHVANLIFFNPLLHAAKDTTATVLR